MFDAIKGYWPDQFAKKWTGLINQAWKDRLGSYTLESVLLALKTFYGQKSFFPRLGEIANMSKPPARISTGVVEPAEWTREKCQEVWLTIDTILANYSDEDLMQHRQTEIKHDWRRALFAKHGIQSQLWRAIIHDRIMKGLSPTDVEDRVIPTRMNGGNLGVVMLKDIPPEEDLI